MARRDEFHFRVAKQYFTNERKGQETEIIENCSNQFQETFFYGSDAVSVIVESLCYLYLYLDKSVASGFPCFCISYEPKTLDSPISVK